jgi:hypothetical protein
LYRNALLASTPGRIAHSLGDYSCEVAN